MGLRHVLQLVLLVVFFGCCTDEVMMWDGMLAIAWVLFAKFSHTAVHRIDDDVMRKNE